MPGYKVESVCSGKDSGNGQDDREEPHSGGKPNLATA
jgi:hypothetical protein